MLTSVPDKSLIVLPFANLSPDADDAYFSDGLTDELITDLSRVAGLRVAPSTASFRLKSLNKDLAAVAREMNVQYVVEGRVRKAGHTVRITAQLVEVAEDRTVWADKYSGDLNDVFELQARVSRSIADALQLQLRPAARAPKPEAVEALLKGRHFARQATSAGFQKALECFDQATQCDPNYAPAFAALADVYVDLTTAWDAMPALETMPKAQAAALRALKLDPTLPEAHNVRAMVAMFYEWDRQTAEREFQEALRLNPNYADAHRRYANFLIWLDPRYEEALAHIQQAIALDPVDPWIQTYAVWVHYFSREYVRAVDQARQAVALTPLYGFAHHSLGCSLLTSGATAEAIASFKRGIELDGRASHYVALLGMAYAIGGQRDKALECLAELDALDKAGRDVAMWQLHVYAGLGDADQVIRCLDVAVARRNSSTLFMLTHPYTDFVRRDPRFITLLEKMGLGDLARRTWTPEWRPPTVAQTLAPAPKPRIQSLAVLPLENLSNDAEQEYFADGMTEAVITELAQIPALRVISRTSVMRFKRTTRSLLDIARDLGVDGIVTGSAMRAGDRVRISAQLVYAATGTHLWAKSYERGMADVLSLQSEWRAPSPLKSR